MSLWTLLLIVCVAGGVGGVVNALLSDNQGFVLPHNVEVAPNHPRIFRPGFLGNILIGAIAAGISWGLYGPFAAYVVFGDSSAANTGAPFLTLSSLVGAIVVGVGGARWLTNEVDKNVLHAAATYAAGKTADPAAAQQIALAPPSEALRVAAGMPGPAH